MTMTPGITQALSHLRAAGYCAEADAMESALASAEPVAWYAPSIDDTCTAAKKAQRERDLPETARLFTVPLYTHAQPAVPVESLGRDAPDPVPLNAVRAALEAVDTGRTQIARDNLRILEIHLRAQSGKPVASVPEGWYVKRDESEIRIGAPDGIPGCMTLTAKERSLPGRILYALALALTTPEPPHAD